MNRKDAKQLDAIDALIEAGELEEALEEALKFTKKRSKIPDGWEQLAYIANELDLTFFNWEASRNLRALQPHDDVHLYNLAVTSIQLGFVFLPRQYVTHYLEHFPDGARKQAIREMDTILDKTIQELVAQGQGPEDYNVAHMALIEMGNLVGVYGSPQEGRKYSRQAAKLMPENPVPLNNIVLSYISEGKLDKAKSANESLLEKHPDNVFARSNQIQLLVRLGQSAEARPLLDTLKDASPDITDYWQKMIEAAAYLNEHEIVTAIFERATQKLKAGAMLDDAILHYGAAAYAFQGDTRKAEKLWKQALRESPGDPLYSQSLTRYRETGPWYFQVSFWVAESWLMSISQVMERAIAQGQVNIRPLVEKQFARNPGLKTGLELALAHGGPESVKTALYLAEFVPLDGLLDFAKGRRGTDDQRARAARLARTHGLIEKTEPLEIFIDGEWQDVRAYHFTVIPDEDLFSQVPEATRPLLKTLFQKNLGEDEDEMVALIDQALELAPDHPVLMTEKIRLLSFLERAEALKPLGQAFIAAHPDHIEARLLMAQLAIDADDLDEAFRWLAPLQERTEFHTTNFRMMALTWITYWQKRGEDRSVKHWINIIEASDPLGLPDDLREEIENDNKPLGWFKSFFG